MATAPTSGTDIQAKMEPVRSVKVSIVRMVASNRGEGCCSAMRWVSSRGGGGRSSAGVKRGRPLRPPPMASGPSLLLGEVVVGHERVRREVEPLVGHNQRGIGLLAVQHLLEEGAVRRLRGRDLVARLDEGEQDLGRRAQ